MSNTSVRIAGLMGRDHFYEQKESTGFHIENPYEWGTPEFTAFADAYILEHSDWEDQQQGLINEDKESEDE